MQKKVIERESSFEAMRIISMLFIIIYHIIFHICSIHSYEMSNGTFIILRFIIAIVIVHVNSFILLTGYFQCEKKLKLSKVIKLNNAVWFYGILFLVIAIILRDYYNFSLTYPIKQLDIYKTIFPLDFRNYWFINNYLILLIISPILNKIIKVYEKKGLLKIIIVSMILFSIIPTITSDGALIFTEEGHSLINFIMLYFIGAYLRLYPINKTRFLNKITPTAERLTYIIMFFSLALISVLFFNMSKQIGRETEIMEHFSSIFFNFHNSFGSPLIIIQSIFYFLFFTTFKFKSRIINGLSGTVFGIYLIHENIYVRDNLYKLLPFFNTRHFGKEQLLMIFLVAILIFITCTIIEAIRKLIFKFIYKRKISKKIRNGIKKYFENLGLNINW